MKESDITDEVKRLSKEIAEYWRMEIYKGRWYVDIDIVCLWMLDETPCFPYEVFPIPSISDCLEKLNKLGFFIEDLYQNPEDFSCHFSMRHNKLVVIKGYIGEKKALKEMAWNLHEALLSALLEALKEEGK